MPEVRTEDPRSDEVLMKAYVAGDQAAFRILFDRYMPMLTRLTMRYTRSETISKEVVQQTFFQLHSARRDFDGSRKLRPWVFTIAMNLVRQHYRKKTRHKEQTLVAEHIGSTGMPKLPGEEEARKKALHQALAELPDNQREVVVLHWFEEKPFAEVASILGVSDGAVRVRAHRAYKRMEEILSADETFYDVRHKKKETTG